jgi:hypothetical protein
MDFLFFMKILFVLFITGLFSLSVKAQESDSTLTYKKRVLESAEVDLLMSYYKQEGEHSAVGGGVGSEELSDGTPTIVIQIPLNDDDVLTFDVGLSAYTSASSSNINPFNSTGASRGGDDDDDEYVDDYSGVSSEGPTGSPWVASSGASRSDVLITGHISYAHQSDDRNFIWIVNTDVSNEFDYTSVGFGGKMARLFNEKNTEIGLKGQVYLDTWRPIYPTELHEFDRYGDSFLNKGYFDGVNVLNQDGQISLQYHPTGFESIRDKGRNSYSLSFSFSQIFGKRWQGSVFFDLIIQKGLLSTPYHRMYFANKENFYIGTASDIPYYTSKQNRGVYQLADDIERMPDSRFKIPAGARLNYYINDVFVFRSYYRYYKDDWGMDAHTVELELPVKLIGRLTFTPGFRYYTQTAADYFGPYDTHLSTDRYYTSDYDLSKFNSRQYSLGLSYTDIFTRFHLNKFGLKNIWTKYSHYSRSDGLSANIISFGIKFVID